MVNIKALSLATAVLSFAGAALSKSTITKPASSQNILPSTFTPPQVFKNTNIIRSINLEKSYPRNVVNVVIENISPEAQDEYYIPFTTQQAERLGNFEVKDNKDLTGPSFDFEAVSIDGSSDTQFYKVRLPQPLAPKSKQTIRVSYSFLSSLRPLPAAIAQQDPQFLVYEFSAYWPSSYAASHQETEVKFSSASVPEYTGNIGGKAESAKKTGSKLTYGPFKDVAAGTTQAVRVRYEHTQPLIHVSRLERDVEVSHWGGNIAFEERYTIVNQAANLSSQFNRVEWAHQQYRTPETTAIKALHIPLRVGSLTPYYTDVIGNISTSRFRSNKREANLELKPRYPIFGGWNYPFRIGWDANLATFLRTVKASDRYVLNVPFLEGPKQQEGITYEFVELRVILPEGATNVKYETLVPIVSATVSTHVTFLDTIGRTALTLQARNLVDAVRDRELIVTYEYPLSAALRKPVVIIVSVLGLFVAVYLLGSLNTGISSKRVKKA
ncbi:hypothetical protein V493_04359 [Pseudogymnoascus sp. VKM F-4281 (FW-2241)]|nr:hypothetical protein V493_04359 [Pseudogymnoascus sp. VKM F-4281 (FW-2241)]